MSDYREWFCTRKPTDTAEECRAKYQRQIEAAETHIATYPRLKRLVPWKLAANCIGGSATWLEERRHYEAHCNFYVAIATYSCLLAFDEFHGSAFERKSVLFFRKVLRGRRLICAPRWTPEMAYDYELDFHNCVTEDGIAYFVQHVAIPNIHTLRDLKPDQNGDTALHVIARHGDWAENEHGQPSCFLPLWELVTYWEPLMACLLETRQCKSRRTQL